MESLSDATAAELGEVSFQLPAQPLAPTMALLSKAVHELQRAGGPTLPPPARDCLAAALQVPVPPGSISPFPVTATTPACTYMHVYHS